MHAELLLELRDARPQAGVILRPARRLKPADAVLEAVQSGSVEPVGPERRSRKAIGRPLTIASAPPSRSRSRASTDGSDGSTTTASGVSAISTRVPSKSRKARDSRLTRCLPAFATVQA